MRKTRENTTTRKAKKYVRTITDINPLPFLESSVHTLVAVNKLSPPIRKQARKKMKIIPDERKKSSRKRPSSPLLSPPLQADINDPDYYEYRTVNSMADIIDSNVDVSNELCEKPRKKIRRRKIEPIDSEVELFKNKNREHRILDFSPNSMSIPSATNDQIALIRDTMVKQTDVVDEARLKKEKSKIRKLRKKGEISSPTVNENVQKSSKNQSTAKSKKPTIKAIENKQDLDKFPVLKDQELMNKFLGVSINNNQKGRIRQLLRDTLKGTSPDLLPELINNKIQAILKSSENLSDSDLRKIRILHNMLKTAIEQQKQAIEVAAKEIKKSENVKENQKEQKDVKKKEKKVKPKRYVVFIGNLPLHVTKEQIMAHFSHISECIKDVRLPQREGKKSAIAYVELENEPAYQLALSQHHSMLGRKRINVLYTANKNSKMSKAEAKAKGAKLTAMAKKGQLIGSVALNKRRSQRRARMRKAMKDAENAQLAQDAFPRPRLARP